MREELGESVTSNEIEHRSCVRGFRTEILLLRNKYANADNFHIELVQNTSA